jgi:putative PIN family toxin of toxin-antitoxin system
MRIVCDTNVLLSGLLFGGNCREVIRLVSEGRVDGFTSNPLLAELEGVLLRPNFGLGADQVEAIIDLVRQTFVLVSPAERVAVVAADPEDDAVLDAAIAANAEVVVSGDSHLLALGGFRRIRVLSPARVVEEVRGQQGASPGPGTTGAAPGE